jgi:uncharacterized protein YbjT (DUF2867 family)
MRTALIAGSTGLVGGQLLRMLLEDNRYDVVKAATRSPLPIQHPKLIQVTIDYSNIEKSKSQLNADDVYCCLGTTMAKAGSKSKFREVDFVYAYQVAKFAREMGAKQFLIVSALGADPRSAVYYNRVKGKMEEAVSALDFHAIHIFRPSLLLGARGEKRPGEEMVKMVYRVFWFIIPDKYKAIEAGKVARAMLYFAGREQNGTFIHESREMQHFKV